jgi:hypothetical protein
VHLANEGLLQDGDMQRLLDSFEPPFNPTNRYYAPDPGFGADWNQCNAFQPWDMVFEFDELFRRWRWSYY